MVAKRSKAITEGPSDGEALRDRWITRITKERKAHKKWRDQAEKAEAAYRDEARDASDDTHKSNPFPIFWSTIQITHAAIFAKSPKPDVRKRYSDGAPSDDHIAQAVQRSLEFTLDTTGFSDHGHRSIDDFLVGGLGNGKVEMKTETAQEPVINPVTAQPIMDEAGKPVLQKVIKRQSLLFRHFHWSKFGWEPGKDWEACDWVRFEHDMTAAEVEEEFGVDLDAGSAKPEGGLNPGPTNKYEQTVTVHEVWDRKTKRQLFICEQHPEPLQVNADPLGLDGFYPCPKPMMLNIKADELVPKPDYQFVQKQCENIQRLSQRIHNLTKNIKDVGFYDAQLQELAQLGSAADGTRIPIKNLAERLNAAGPGRMSFDAVVANQDNTAKSVVLTTLIQQRDIEKNALFEALGIADIVRGATVASETAAAQTIKSQWANVRIGPKVQAVSYFFRDVFRIMGEIISEHFEPEQINQMSGMELGPEEIGALKDDLTRSYAIDIEADSTMAQDDAEEKGQRLEMLATLTDYLAKLLPLVQGGQLPADFVKQQLLFAVRSFKYGRQMEESIQAMPDNIAQLKGLQDQLMQTQQQLEQASMQGEQMQAELQKLQQAGNDPNEPIRKDMTTRADVDLKAAQTRKTDAEAARDAAMASVESSVQQSHEQAQQGMEVAVQVLAQAAQQIESVVPVLAQAAEMASQRPQRVAVIRDESGRIAGAEVVA